MASHARTTNVLLRACAALGACLLLALSAAGARAATDAALLPFNPASQSHPGACSQNTTSVARAVADLGTNGVIAQYAQVLGVHGSAAALPADLRQALTVVRVSKTTVTDNHGCNGSGVVFNVGPRVLYPGETVGVALPAALRARLCSGPEAGCERVVYTARTVLPTNCWNIDDGAVQVTIYVRKPQTKAELITKQPKPSAKAALSCSAGGVVLTLANGAGATAAAAFDVDGKAHGPVAAGKHVTVTVKLADGATKQITVYSDGKELVGRAFTSTCGPAPAPQPAATAAQSCSAGGVVVTLSNAASATADATFNVNGTTYGPLAPGATQAVTVPVAPGATVVVDVSSGSDALISAESFTSTCAAAPAATAELLCDYGEDEEGFSGGAIVIQLSDGAGATLPATFTVTATGNTVGGFGPASFGPVSPGGALTEYVPVDASYGYDEEYDLAWPPITLTVTVGGQTVLTQTFDTGCGFEDLG